MTTQATAASAQPAPLFRDDERVLFQGDSITDGNRGRTADPNHILGHGYAFVIAARHAAAYPERGLTFLNRGISGNRVADLAARWQADALDLRPTTLSVLVGINDVGVNFSKNLPVDVAAYETTYDQLLADARRALAGVRFVLLEPFFLPGKGTAARLDEWSHLVGQMREVVARLGAKYDAPVVRLQQTFDGALKRAPIDYWIWDGVHPTYAGHQLIADAWERAYAEFYGPPPATRRPTTLPSP